MRIRLTLPVILLVNLISGNVYELEDSPFVALGLVIGGLPFDARLSRDVAKMIPHFKVEEIRERFNFILKEADRNAEGLLNNGSFLIEEAKSYLDDLKRDESIDGELKGILISLSERLEEVQEGPINVLIDPIQSIYNALDAASNSEEFKKANEWLKMTRKIRSGLSEYFKAQGRVPRIVPKVFSLLRNLDEVADDVGGPDEKTLVGILNVLKYLVDQPSDIHKYCDASVRPSVDLLDIAGEIKALAHWINGDEFKAFFEYLEKFYNLKAFPHQDLYRKFRESFSNKDISDLFIQVAYHLSGEGSFELLEKIYTTYELRKGDGQDFVELRAMDDVEIICVFYLWGFKMGLGNQEYLKNAILTNEISNFQLMELIKVVLNYVSPIIPESAGRILVENPIALSLIESVISVCDEFFDKVFSSPFHDPLLHRQALLGFDQIKIANNTSDEGIAQFIHKEFEYASLSGTREALRKLEERTKLEGINDSVTKSIQRNAEELKNQFGLAEQEHFEKRGISLILFYYKYPFAVLDTTIDDIRKNIDLIITNITYLLKRGRLKDQELDGCGGSFLNQLMEVYSFLPHLKHYFDLMTAFPGIKLSPFERRLYDLAKQLYKTVSEVQERGAQNRTYLIPERQEEFEIISSVFSELLPILETWREVIEYRGVAEDRGPEH